MRDKNHVKLSVPAVKEKSKQNKKMSLQVLKLYKTLNRTIQKVFRNDPIGISAANLEIRKEFDKNRDVTSENTQKELIQYGYEVNYVLDQKVLQLQQMDDKGRYKANIRPDMEFGIDTPYRDDITEEQYREANRGAKQKCSSYNMNKMTMIDKNEQ